MNGKYKIIIQDVGSSRAVQKHAFKLGYSWPSGNTEVKMPYVGFFYLSEDKTITFGISDMCYLVDTGEALSVNEFLSIKPVVHEIIIDGESYTLNQAAYEQLLRDLQ